MSEADLDFEWMVNAPSRIARIAERAAEFNYRITKFTVMRLALRQVRDGVLPPNWRDQAAALTGETVNLPVELRTARERVVAEIADLPIQEWEPGTGVGWRKCLDAWFDATKSCLGEVVQAETRVTAETYTPMTAVERLSMETDLATASYRAGLTAGGLDIPDWFDWLIDRVQTWPDKQRRDDQLDLMTLEPGYRTAIQRLPDYWA
ncbi:MAG TPA: hypothetical protein VHY82_09420 [Acetobacteraceae bacterium]|nr:hypothetical protein [Acetobacteraceae bacterium]